MATCLSFGFSEGEAHYCNNKLRLHISFIFVSYDEDTIKEYCR